MSPLTTETRIRSNFLRELQKASSSVGIDESKQFDILGQKVKIVYGFPDDTVDTEKIGGKFKNPENNFGYYFIIL